MPLWETSKRQETREIWSYGGWPNIVLQDSWRELERARESKRGDIELFTDGVEVEGSIEREIKTARVS